MSETEHTHHAIDYVELTVPDLSAARTFYAAAFDWSFNEYGPNYLGIRHPAGGEQGGLAPGEPKPGGPLVVLYSEDLEATQARVEAAGGKVVVPIFEFPGGRRLHFADPAGNVLAVWSLK